MSGEIEFINLKREFEIEYRFTDYPTKILWCNAVVKYHGSKRTGHKADVIMVYPSTWKDRFSVMGEVVGDFDRESALEFVSVDCKDAIIQALNHRYDSDYLEVMSVKQRQFRLF